MVSHIVIPPKLADLEALSISIHILKPLLFDE
jgi:hypothetical protein